MIPGKWKLQIAERSGQGTVCFSHWASPDRPPSGSIERDVSGDQSSQEEIRLNEIAAHVAKQNLRAKQEKEERRAATARTRAPPQGEGEVANSDHRQVDDLQRPPTGHGQAAVLSPKVRRPTGRRRGQSRSTNSHAGESDEYYERLWRRHPIVFKLSGPALDESGAGDSGRIREAARRRRANRNPQAINLEDLIEEDSRQVNRHVASTCEGDPV